MRILNFLIDPLIESGPYPERIDYPARIASEFRNRSARPASARLKQKFGPGPARPDQHSARPGWHL